MLIDKFSSMLKSPNSKLLTRFKSLCLLLLVILGVLLGNPINAQADLTISNFDGLISERRSLASVINFSYLLADATVEEPEAVEETPEAKAAAKAEAKKVKEAAKLEAKKLKAAKKAAKAEAKKAKEAAKLEAKKAKEAEKAAKAETATEEPVEEKVKEAPKEEITEPLTETSVESEPAVSP